ncbi:stage III sporulation protein AG [Paenibacillus sp. J2TS4]|uniref:stage III sporulation protein AG n=1 Tax=Paenibacillus sp. J2TS4 TaxID=2807194 RepID=UPI001B0FECCD|nr:stage III sporulation protein AG [Paenibacillus sp. J2TS4]GIP32267.1 stage III sporulation protein AG [Paenibacillus sp. J2TS4]
MGKWIKMIEQWISGGPGGPKRIQALRWLLIIGLTGAALMIMNSFISVKEIDPASTGPPKQEDVREALAFGGGSKEGSVFRDYEQAYESRLKDVLEKIVGVGEVEVMVTIDSTEEIQVEKNTKESQQVTNEKDQTGSTRNNSDVTRSSDAVMMQQSGGEQPLVLKYMKPKIRGVVVVAKGAENVTVKKLIVEAVGRGLDVPANRISVVPRKQ